MRGILMAATSLLNETRLASTARAVVCRHLEASRRLVSDEAKPVALRRLNSLAM